MRWSRAEPPEEHAKTQRPSSGCDSLKARPEVPLLDPHPTPGSPRPRRALFAIALSAGVHLLGVGALLAWPTAEPPQAPLLLEVGRIELPGSAPGDLQEEPEVAGPAAQAAPEPAPVATSEPRRTPEPMEPPAPPQPEHAAAPQADAEALQALASLADAAPADPSAAASQSPQDWIDEALQSLPADGFAGDLAQSVRSPAAGQGASGALSPEAGGAESSALAVWRVRVQSHLMRGFRPPPASHDDLACRVHIWIDPHTGDVTRTALAESSGVVAWDQAALRAVETVGSLPAPPRTAAPLLSDGFAVRFVHPQR